ncbi:LOW QUALITY PROTEIN: hypothetical protein PHMEG_0004071 [Phytophthora megakarya]|uniref:Uncharacterized protein n=1 Tax=Phytophthora megakarya TaxID=4795 RepID=A0A225WUP2_9STRA|nr:LOW QUALITY PROTEIN: hypothetical protein PHMEG_0004071 [Phytophthora megakarya]
MTQMVASEWFSKANVHTRRCHNMELVVAAPEGVTGIFPHPLLAPTLWTIHGGRIKVPVVNLVGWTTKVPPIKKLGTWSPTSDRKTVMGISGELDRECVTFWMEAELKGGA